MRNGIPLNNNNRNNNNRRRGRGNRPQGGGSQGNRIDSRARGNAPQLLDKFKKLAQDAQHNGDRVQAEYYLQFADHYFRVIADNRSRHDEPRGDARMGRRDEREQDDFDAEDEDDGDSRRFDGRDREPRERDNREGETRERDTRERETRERDQRRDRPRREFRSEPRSEEGGALEVSEGPSFEPGDNPFAADVREPREDRPKRRGPRARHSGNGAGGENEGIDAAALPPSFSVAEPAAGPSGDQEIEAAAPRPRRKRSEGGTLSAVG